MESNQPQSSEGAGFRALLNIQIIELDGVEGDPYVVRGLLPGTGLTRESMERLELNERFSSPVRALEWAIEQLASL